MLIPSYSLIVHHEEINGVDFTPDCITSTNFLFRIAPKIDRTNCVYQVVMETNIDCFNGNSIESRIEIRYIIDTPFENKRPILMDFLFLSKKAVEYGNKYFNETILPQVVNLRDNCITIFEEMEAIKEIGKEIEKSYPNTPGIVHIVGM